MTSPERLNTSGLNKGLKVNAGGSKRKSVSNSEAGFRNIQMRVLKELRHRTEPEKLKKMELDDIAKVLKTCNENLRTIHQRKMQQGIGGNQIEFVMKTPVEKK